jgi:hypothetical protein
MSAAVTMIEADMVLPAAVIHICPAHLTHEAAIVQ